MHIHIYKCVNNDELIVIITDDKIYLMLLQGLLDDLDATLVSEVYISRPSYIY